PPPRPPLLKSRGRQHADRPPPRDLRGRTSRARKELPGDDETLDLAGALADRGELHVAKVFLGGIVLDESVATVDLHAVVSRLHGNLDRIELGHRLLERGTTAPVFEVRGAVREQPGSLDSCRIIGELPLNRLVGTDRLA